MKVDRLRKGRKKVQQPPDSMPYSYGGSVHLFFASGTPGKPQIPNSHGLKSSVGQAGRKEEGRKNDKKEKASLEREIQRADRFHSNGESSSF